MYENKSLLLGVDVGSTIVNIVTMRLKGKTIHEVAAKCGVLVETDVAGFIKAGVDKEEIFISLCEAVAR